MLYLNMMMMMTTSTYLGATLRFKSHPIHRWGYPQRAESGERRMNFAAPSHVSECVI